MPVNSVPGGLEKHAVPLDNVQQNAETGKQVIEITIERVRIGNAPGRNSLDMNVALHWQKQTNKQTSKPPKLSFDVADVNHSKSKAPFSDEQMNRTEVWREGIVTAR